MVPGPRYHALLNILRSADGLWDASRRFLEPWGLGPSQFNVLNVLSDRPQGYSQIEVGRLLITHRSNVTGLVDRLVKRGWVKRRDATEDRRAYRIVLTPAGRKILNGILPSYYRAAEEIWRGVTIRNSSRLADELEVLCDHAVRTVENYQFLGRYPKARGPRLRDKRTRSTSTKRNGKANSREFAKTRRVPRRKGGVHKRGHGSD
jgi:DNA-binding MarR family transcriptional regulator